MKFSFYKYLLTLVVLTFLYVSCASPLPEYLIQGTQGQCEETISNEASATVKSHTGVGSTKYAIEDGCKISFHAKNGSRIFVQFPFFDLPSQETDNCTVGQDLIEISETVGGTDKKMIICKEQAVTSLTNKIGIRFMTGWSSDQSTGFTALLTSFHEGECSDAEFQCDGTRCISSDLRCDDHRHCLDGADENSTLARCLKTIKSGDTVTGAILGEAAEGGTSIGTYGVLAIGIIVGGILLTTFITAILWKYLKTDRKCCDCTDFDDDDNDVYNLESQLSSTSGKHADAEREKLSTKMKKSGTKVVGKTYEKQTEKEDCKKSKNVKPKKITVTGKADPDIEW